MRVRNEYVPAIIFFLSTASSLFSAGGVRVGLTIASTTKEQSHTAAEAPDAGGAVGPDHVVEFINGDFKAYDKISGKQLQALTSQDFWVRAGAPGGAEANRDNKDPRMIYDRFARRWYASAQRTYGSTKGDTSMVLARSDTPDPTGGWKAFGFPVSEQQAPGFADFDVMGCNSVAVYISMNQFGIRDGKPWPEGLALFVIKKSDLNQAAPVFTMQRLEHLSDIREAGPVLDFDGSSKAVSFLGKSTTRSQDKDLLSRSTLAGDLTAWKLERTAAAVGAREGEALDRARFPPVTVPQPGGKGISSMSGQPSTVPLVKGELWTVQTIAAPDDPKRSALRWLRVRESDNALLGSGVLGDPAVSVFNPSIAVDAGGNIVVACHGTGPKHFAGAFAFTGHATKDGVAFDPILILKAGEGNHNGSIRWGDYSVVAPDPSEPGVFWLFQAWAQTSGDWATQITQLVFPK